MTAMKSRIKISFFIHLMDANKSRLLSAFHMDSKMALSNSFSFDIQLEDPRTLVHDEENILECLTDDNKDDIAREMDLFEKTQRPTSSLNQERYHVNSLRKFAKDNGYDEEFESLEIKDLDTLLRRFYCNLHKQDGNPYSCASLLCIRAAIFRHLSNAPWNKPYNLISDREFLASNNMLKAKMAQSMKSGKVTKHYEMIQEGDQKILENYFDRSTPQKLQEEAWYTFVYHFGNRGREGIKELKKQDFVFRFDSDGKEYCELDSCIDQKNVTPDNSESVKCARIYSTGRENCPVQCLKLYLSTIENTGHDSFWPKAKRVPTANCWYETKQIVGRTVLGEMMKRISRNAGLSRIYTNHCVRPTVVSNLKTSGFKNEEICLITGHKSETSIRRYDRLVHDRTLKRLSSSLSKENVVNEKIKISEGVAFNSCVFQNCNFY